MESKELSIGEATRAIQRGELSALELAESVLDQIDRLDGTINAFITLRPPAEILEEARNADERRVAGETRGPLDGIPIGLKDNFATAGLKTTAGSKILADWIPDQDATVVSKLKQAGAVIIGKLNMHEFADGPTTDNPHYGRTRNPWNLGRIPGGSSGGSGAALAADMCLGSMGTDTGGSIRSPAAFCGIVGLKPTYGRVSRSGVIPFSWSLDHAGPMARTVLDVAILLQVVEGFDPADPGSVRVPSQDYLGSVGASLHDVVVGVETTYLTRLMQGGVRQAFDNSLRAMNDLGAEIDEIALPSMEAALWAELAILFPEAAAYHHNYLEDRLGEYGEDVRLSLLSGRLYRAVDYVKAQQVRAVMRRELAQAFTRMDILAMPTMVVEAPEWDRESFVLDGEEYDPLGIFVRCLAPFNLSGNPALSVPYDYGEDGLPVGLQLVGRPFDEAILFRVGQALEVDFRPHRRKPEIGESS